MTSYPRKPIFDENLMSNSALKTPCVEIVDGCAVHGDVPLTDPGREAMRAVIEAAKRKIDNDKSKAAEAHGISEAMK